MNRPKARLVTRPGSIRKVPTGIQGLDEITGGGLPAGRPTLVCGGPGCGKTLLAMEFLVRGATEFGEPGVFIAFEESARDLADNVRSLGFDLDRLVSEKRIAIDYVRIERSEIEETGEYDLDGLFVRIEHAIDTVGAKRVVLDTVEALFGGLPNENILRAELRRLFRWLKDRGMTAVITAERGDGTLSRHGLEEFVADCVVVLDHRISEQVSTRRLRVVKYRGSLHGNNEYPFLIGARGLSVLPVTSMGLDHKASGRRVSSGLPRLDAMLGGKGYYRGSSILVTGSPGTGKTSIAAAFAEAACRRGERCLMFVYEESASQIARNMRSIGIDLERWVDKGLLAIRATRPTLHGLEGHLVAIHDEVQRFEPSAVVIDPITNLTLVRNEWELKPLLMRLIDFLKTRQVTALFTSLTSGGDSLEESQVGVSSLMDAWLLLRNIESNGERNRTFYVLKARGLAHSNQVSEFVLSDKGIDLVEPYLGADQVLTGTARVVQEAHDRAAAARRAQDHEAAVLQLTGRRKAIAAQLAALEAELDVEDRKLAAMVREAAAQRKAAAGDRRAVADLRHGKRPSNGRKEGKGR
ncbi:MAG: circadian clock protein KaiC [Acidobacteriia bacterium]|nr:circadian clock protein KaiC [Terriglobia bacterium]